MSNVSGVAALSDAVLAFQFYPEYVLRGAIVGLTYGLLALGVVLVFRSSNIINFAHGEIGLFAAVIFVKLVNHWHLPYWIGFAVALAIGAAGGVIAEVVLVRRLRNAPRLMSVVATLGFGAFLGLFAAAIAGNETSAFPKPTGFPTFKVRTFFVSQPHVAIVVLSPLVMLAIGVFLRSSRTGIGVRAAAANPEAARMAGVSPARMSAIAWGLAGALSAYTALLVRPALGFAATGTTNAPGLLIRALTVAVIARMSSIPITLVAGVAVGVVESILQLNYNNGGPVEVALFLAAVTALMVQSGRRGRGVVRDNWASLQPWSALPASLTRHPLLRRLGWIMAAVGLVGAIGFGLAANNEQASVGSLLLRTAMIGLSIFLLTGLGGQLTLGQFGIASIAGACAIRFVNGPGEFASALVVGAIVGALISVLLGIPALRVRGLMLAVTTLAFAIATRSWLTSQPWMIGEGLTLEERTLFGIDLSTDRRMYWVVLVLLVVVFIAVRNISRSGFGRRLIALRDNEDQARAFTVSSVRTLLAAYGASGFIAGLGGAVFALSLTRLGVDSVKVDDSIQVTALAVLGGLGIVAGPILGALYIIGLPELPLDSLGLAATSLGWLVLLLYVPSGIAGLVAPLRNALVRYFKKTGPEAAPATNQRVQISDGADQPLQEGTGVVVSAALQQRAAIAAAAQDPSSVVRTVGVGEVICRINKVSKRFGGVVAVDDVSVDIIRGETLGLIGPNGAGKTTLFEIMGGFTTADSGSIEFEGRDVTKLPSNQRASAGLVRSFQDAPLFATLTVRDTVRLAHERLQPTGFWPSLVGVQAKERRVAASADDLIEMMGLQSYARKSVSDLSTGTRRITELACLIAMRPSLLLLDEPSSGIAQRETEKLGELLRSIKAHLGTTVVVIEHDISMIRSLSDRLIAMESGRIIAVGSPAAVLANAEVISSYLGGDQTAIERSG